MMNVSSTTGNVNQIDIASAQERAAGGPVDAMEGQPRARALLQLRPPLQFTVLPAINQASAGQAYATAANGSAPAVAQSLDASYDAYYDLVEFMTLLVESGDQSTQEMLRMGLEALRTSASNRETHIQELEEFSKELQESEDKAAVNAVIHGLRSQGTAVERPAWAGNEKTPMQQIANSFLCWVQATGGSKHGAAELLDKLKLEQFKSSVRESIRANSGSAETTALIERIVTKGSVSSVLRWVESTDWGSDEGRSREFLAELAKNFSNRLN